MVMTLREHMETRAIGLNKEYDPWRSEYQELSEFILPWRGRFTVDDVNRGPKKSAKIINNHASLASRVQSAGMMAGITSPARPWFQIETPDPDLNQFGPVRVWLSDVQKILLQIFNRSNIYNSLHNFYAEIGTFATASTVIVEDFDTVMRGHTFTAGEYRLGSSGRGDIDTLYREQYMTVKQMVDQFGDNVSSTVKDLYDKSSYHDRVVVCHMIEPNVDGLRIDKGNINPEFEYRSIYYEKSEDKETYLKDSGFDTKPFLAGRWEVVGGDTYGSKCSGIECLDDVKELQECERQKKKAIEKQVDPPMTGPASLKNSPSNTLAGGVTYVDAINQDAGFRPAYQVNYKLAEALEDIRKIEDRISKTYYEDLFLMISQSDRRQITAREIEEKHEEKLLGLGPVLERLNDELLDPLIDRAFSIAEKKDLLPPPPQEILDLGGDLRVEYISIMAQAQKSIGISGLESMVAFGGAIANYNQKAIRKINFDEALDQYADMKGVDPKILHDEETLARMDAEDAEREAAAQAVEQAPAMAKTVRDLSESETEDGSALDVLLRQGT